MKAYEIVLPSKFVDMDAHQMEYDGSLGWAGRFFIAGIVFAVAGGGCLLLNRVFDIGDKDTMTGITLGAFGASLVCLGIGGLFLSRSANVMENTIIDQSDKLAKVNNNLSMALDQSKGIVNISKKWIT